MNGPYIKCLRRGRKGSRNPKIVSTDGQRKVKNISFLECELLLDLTSKYLVPHRENNFLTQVIYIRNNLPKCIDVSRFNFQVFDEFSSFRNSVEFFGRLRFVSFPKSKSKLSLLQLNAKDYLPRLYFLS